MDVVIFGEMKNVITQLALLGNYLAVASFWMSVWLYRALLVTFFGGCMGFLIAPITKVLFFKQSAWSVVLKGGFVTGIQYAGLWATAIALVWVIMDRKHVMSTVIPLLGGEKARVKTR